MPTSPTPVPSECTQQQGSLPAPTPRGRLVVLTGPSGVGKGTLVNQLRQRHPELYLSVSVTTRPPPPQRTGRRQLLLSQSGGISQLD